MVNDKVLTAEDLRDMQDELATFLIALDEWGAEDKSAAAKSIIDFILSGGNLAAYMDEERSHAFQ